MKNVVLTPTQSVEARENLNLQQPAVVSGIKSEHPDITFTKTYLSEFESGVRNLPPKTLRAMRDFYEAQGHEFNDTPEAANDPQAGDEVRVVRDALVVSDRLTHSQRGAIQDRVRDQFAQLHADLRQKAGRGMFELYDDETDLARDKAIAAFAEIGILYASLLGNDLLKPPSDALLKAQGEAKTISDVLSIRFAGALNLISESRSEDGSAGASGGDDDDPALDGDGSEHTATRATTNQRVASA